jgi:hypothetical protein
MRTYIGYTFQNEYENVGISSFPLKRGWATVVSFPGGIENDGFTSVLVQLNDS